MRFTIVMLLFATGGAFVPIGTRTVPYHVRFSMEKKWNPNREEILKQIMEQEESGEEITPEDLPSIDLDDDDDADLAEVDNVNRYTHG